MVINWRQNKLIGPGGGTRRLHHKHIKGKRMKKIKDIIKITIGLEVIVILAFLGVLMLQEMELKEISIYTWQEKIEQIK
jgi:hypothetical protein